MAIEELNDLLAMFPDADRQQVSEILTRNEAARTLLEGQHSIYKAMVDGNTTEIEHLQNKFKPAATSASLDLDDILNKLAPKLDARFDERFGSKQTDIKKLAKEVAEEVAKSYEGQILGRSAKLSDEIYQIRRTHEREFGTELDTPKLEAFLDSNKGKFSSLTNGYDNFVNEERIQKRIETAVKAAKLADDTTNVPGASAPQSVMGSMIKNNEKRMEAAKQGNGETWDGPTKDEALKAFRRLQNAHLTS